MAKFIPGCIFGKEIESESLLQRYPVLRKSYGRRDKAASIPTKEGQNEAFGRFSPRKGWKIWNTTLEKMAGKLEMDFKDFLLEKIIEAEREGRKLRVLNVGVGGSAWPQEILDRIEFHGTALSHTYDERLKRKVKIATAAQLHKKFKASYFDIVVSHAGMHGEELHGIENIMHILKPGGHAVLTMSISNETKGKVSNSSYYVIHQIASSNTATSVHLEKKS